MSALRALAYTILFGRLSRMTTDQVVEMLPDPRAARSFLLSSRFVRMLDGYHLVKTRKL